MLISNQHVRREAEKYLFVAAPQTWCSSRTACCSHGWTKRVLDTIHRQGLASCRHQQQTMKQATKVEGGHASCGGTLSGVYVPASTVR